MKKRVVIALGHRALGTTLPEQQLSVKHTAKCIADLIEEGFQVGGDIIRSKGIHLESLAIVESMDEKTGEVVFRN